MLDKKFVLAGLLGPIVFAIIILITGSMYPNYNHTEQVISKLGAIDSPVKDLMNIFGFMLFGFLRI